MQSAAAGGMIESMSRRVGRITLGAFYVTFALASTVRAETVRVAVCQMRVEDAAIAANLASAQEGRTRRGRRSAC